MPAAEASPALRPPPGGALSDLALDLHGVSKIYKGSLFGGKSVHALREIDMRVHRGEIFGLLGPNGAGKSTLVKILMTVIRPTSCRGLMLGKPVGTKSSLRRVGYLPEHHKFPEYLTAAQLLDYFGALSDVPRDVRKKRAAELLDLVGLGSWTRHRVKGFSKGMRQRLGIANALMMDPELVVLDEPTDGVDPVGRRDIRSLLTKLRDEGRTVFLNSHLLSELEMVCDRVAILVQGKVFSQGTIDELTRDSRRFEIEVAPPAGSADSTPLYAFVPAALEGVARLRPSDKGESSTPPVATSPAKEAVIRGTIGPTEMSIGTTSIRISTEDAAIVQPIIDALRSRGLVIRCVRPVRESLEDLFMRAVKDPGSGRVLAVGASSDGVTGKSPEPKP